MPSPPSPDGDPAGGGGPEVLCFGEALVDRLEAPGGDGAEDRLGGAPANVACALARLGTPVALLGRLGQDGIGEAFRDLFLGRGVDISGLQWDERRPSRIVLVRRDASGDRSFGGFVGDRGEGFADQAVSTEELLVPLAPLLSGARWLLVGTIPLASPASASALMHLVEQARAHGIAVAVDVNWRPTFWDPQSPPDAGPTPAQIARIRPLLEQASLIKCAAEEAAWLFEDPDPLVLHASLPRRPAVLVTDGARPMNWCIGGRSGMVEAFDVEVVDTTGAGDAFTAGLLDGLCRRPELLAGDGSGGGGAADPVALRQLLRFATACGALVCTAAGAIDPQPTRSEVDAFLRRAG